MKCRPFVWTLGTPSANVMYWFVQNPWDRLGGGNEREYSRVNMSQVNSKWMAAECVRRGRAEHLRQELDQLSSHIPCHCAQQQTPAREGHVWTIAVNSSVFKSNALHSNTGNTKCIDECSWSKIKHNITNSKKQEWREPITNVDSAVPNSSRQLLPLVQHSIQQRILMVQTNKSITPSSKTNRTIRRRNKIPENPQTQQYIYIYIYIYVCMYIKHGIIDSWLVALNVPRYSASFKA
jgi:hypothetical protein